MKIHRFISNFDLSKAQLEINDKEIVNQMKNVLRLKVGELVELCDGKGISTMVDIVEIRKNNIKVKITTPLHQDSAGQNSTKKVNLFCAILKKENFELVVQKTTECGVSKIVPIITSRTIKNGLNLERLKKIAKEASEQCGRITIPEILEPIKFIEITEGSPLYGINIIFDANGKPLGGLAAKGEFINIFIGPEGGWTKEEIEKTKKLNFKTASLGPLTLRGETAAIIATYLIANTK